MYWNLKGECMRRLSIAILISVCLTLQPSFAQSASQASTQLDQHAEKVKREVEKIGIARKITVILKTGAESYGSVAQIDDTTFRIAEVDLRQEMTFEYQEVKKVRPNFGGKNYISGQRPNPLWGKIALVGLLGGLITLAALVGRS
jgi:hypothetical protein